MLVIHVKQGVGDAEFHIVEGKRARNATGVCRKIRWRAQSRANQEQKRQDKDQRDRNSAISQFKKNSNSILIATDVASRGLDIDNIAVVINFDAAKNIDSHVHRVGRAGRLRKESNDGTSGQHQRGVAYTLLTDKDANFAVSLADAFEREGRKVSPELTALCQKSNRYGGGRMKHSKDGLGFNGAGAGSTMTNKSAGTSSYYGPSSNSQPVKKKSRWG